MTGKEHVGSCKEVVPTVSWSGCGSDGCVHFVKIPKWYTFYFEKVFKNHFPILPGSPRTLLADEMGSELGFQENLWQGANSEAQTFCLSPTCPLLSAGSWSWFLEVQQPSCEHMQEGHVQKKAVSLRKVPSPGGLKFLISGIFIVFILMEEKWFTFDCKLRHLFLFSASCFIFCLSFPFFLCKTSALIENVSALCVKCVTDSLPNVAFVFWVYVCV